MRKKMEARAEAMHHHQHSAVDGEHHDMRRDHEMYQNHEKPNMNAEIDRHG
jgi:hypothetical protein